MAANRPTVKFGSRKLMTLMYTIPIIIVYCVLVSLNCLQTLMYYYTEGWQLGIRFKISFSSALMFWNAGEFILQHHV